MGEVSCGCFLFTALALRGAGSGCLLTVLGRGGEGREFRRANHTPSDSERDHVRQRNSRSSDYERERQKDTPHPEFSETTFRTKNPKRT